MQATIRNFLKLEASGGIVLMGAAVLAMIVANTRPDLYLRHAGVMALAGTGGAASLMSHPSEEARLCAVVALRRRGDPRAGSFLYDSSSLVVAEAAAFPVCTRRSAHSSGPITPRSSR